MVHRVQRAAKDNPQNLHQQSARQQCVIGGTLSRGPSTAELRLPAGQAACSAVSSPYGMIKDTTLHAEQHTNAHNPPACKHGHTERRRCCLLFVAGVRTAMTASY